MYHQILIDQNSSFVSDFTAHWSVGWDPGFCRKHRADFSPSASLAWPEHSIHTGPHSYYGHQVITGIFPGLYTGLHIKKAYTSLCTSSPNVYTKSYCRLLMHVYISMVMSLNVYTNRRIFMCKPVCWEYCHLWMHNHKEVCSRLLPMGCPLSTGSPLLSVQFLCFYTNTNIPVLYVHSSSV